MKFCRVKDIIETGATDRIAADYKIGHVVLAAECKDIGTSRIGMEWKGENATIWENNIETVQCGELCPGATLWGRGTTQVSLRRHGDDSDDTATRDRLSGNWRMKGLDKHEFYTFF
jgi:hypothetical protein